MTVGRRDGGEGEGPVKRGGRGDGQGASVIVFNAYRRKLKIRKASHVRRSRHDTAGESRHISPDDLKRRMAELEAATAAEESRRLQQWVKKHKAAGAALWISGYIRSEPMTDEKNSDVEADGKLKRKDYERELARLHVEFVKLQLWVVRKGLRVCVVFEGRDGAGKGGTIKAITERVSPRIFRVVALPAPTEREKSQMYAQRYLPHMPAAGEIVIFDRSWYNRAGVERVMGFCTEEEVKRFLEMVPAFERVVVEDGIVLLKYWLEVSPEEQTRRLEGRIDDGRKIWKLSDMDLKSYSRWYDYSRARDEMFQASDTSWAPWYVVHSDNKRKARLNILTHILSKIPYEEPKREKVELPKRQHRGDYKDPDYPFRLIPEVF
jgi:polyphosphate kinase